MTKTELKTRARNLTAAVGKAKAAHDEERLRKERIKRGCVMKELALVHDVWTLVNPEGQTEFVDRAEWEQRMTAWARRQGIIPRASIPNSPRAAEPPAAPPENS